MSDAKEREENDGRTWGATTFTCGPQCIDGKEEHQWDGPIVEFDNGSTASCSKCGELAIDVSLWELP
jgi:hypothetical protein